MFKKAYTTLVIIGLVAAASMVITHFLEREDQKKNDKPNNKSKPSYEEEKCDEPEPVCYTNQ